MARDLNALLVRHGESSGNAGLPAADAASAPLTPIGERHARAVSAAISEPPGLIVVSSYARSRQTALPTCERFAGVPVEEWPVQEFTYLAAVAYHGTTEPDRLPAMEAYWAAADPHRVEGEGAESFAAFLARVQSVRERLEHAACSSLVMFSHKKFITALLWSLLVGPPRVSSRRMSRYRGFDRAVSFPNGACVDVRLGEAGPWVGGIRTRHLEVVQP